MCVAFPPLLAYVRTRVSMCPRARTHTCTELNSPLRLRARACACGCGRLGDWVCHFRSLMDAELCIALRPDWFRGWLRAALALSKLNVHSAALACINEALQVEVGIFPKFARGCDCTDAYVLRRQRRGNGGQGGTKASTRKQLIVL